jgi:sulfonate transport system substrate-binding protein
MWAIWLLAGLAILMNGCSRVSSAGSASAAIAGAPAPDSAHVLRFGYQKGGAPSVLRGSGDLDRRLAAQGVGVQWVEFPAGPQMLEALGAGSLDLGITGDGPVAFAQAAGVPVVYVANVPAGDMSGRAILVPHDSPIKTVADLRGKRIAVQKGSGTHNFLIEVLQKAAIPYGQIQPVYLAPPDARAAFDAGRVDAWAIWDPFMTIAQRKDDARVLIDGNGTLSAGSFYLSTRTFATQHPDWIRTALEELDKTAAWIAVHPHDASIILSKVTKVDVPTLDVIEARVPKGERYVAFHPIDDSVLKIQQTVADNFLAVGLLPKKVNVRDASLTPAQYAALTPQASAKVATAK